MADMPTSPIDRRVWRLGFLLTGNADAASSLIGLVRRTRKDAASLEPAILDRMIIQNARSLAREQTASLPAVSQSTPATLATATDALSAALKLSRQPLEAWVLKRLDDLDDLHIARAMDCSKSAARLHLGAADESIALRLGDRLSPCIAALRDYADSLNPATLIDDYHIRIRQARARRIKVIAVAAAAAILVLSYVALKLLLSG